LGCLTCNRAEGNSSDRNVHFGEWGALAVDIDGGVRVEVVGVCDCRDGSLGLADHGRGDRALRIQVAFFLLSRNGESWEIAEILMDTR
jgi:hypothetical protein